jgi:hypothetical protein
MPCKNSSPRPEVKGTRGAFAQHWRALLTAGFSPIPICRATKHPLPKGWPRFGPVPITEEEGLAFVRRWPRASLGLALGFNGLVAIDFDGAIAEAETAILRLLPPSPAVKIGRRGWTAFYRTVEPIRSRHLVDRDRAGLVDILGLGAQTVVPPSEHPAGGLYRWREGEGLARIPVVCLPLVPSDIADRIEAALRPWLPEPPAPRPADHRRTVRCGQELRRRQPVGVARRLYGLLRAPHAREDRQRRRRDLLRRRGRHHDSRPHQSRQGHARDRGKAPDRHCRVGAKSHQRPRAEAVHH